jgi:L-seryl-tRNA(Ser) seleniumtransferase
MPSGLQLGLVGDVSTPGATDSAGPARRSCYGRVPVEGAASSTSATGTTVYDRLGTRPVVNCRGVYSELGGAIIEPNVWAAMTEAAGMAASMSELLEATGRRLAELLGAEAGRVTPGAAAAIALGTAACVTRGDGAASERLPDTSGLPDEVLLQRVQRPKYKYARLIWMTGAELRLVGTEEGTSREDLENALDSERVAAVFVPAHLDEEPGALPLRDVAAVAHEHGVPTLVDAAFLNYPPDSMRRFTEEGGDLVCFSAKYCYGPNTGGFVVGRSDLVEAVAVVDFTGFESERWAIFGRPFKLDLHTVVGTTLAVEEWMELDHEARWRSYAELVDELAAAVQGIAGVRSEPRFFTMVETIEPEPVNCLVVHVDPQEAGVSAADVERTLDESNPRVAVHRWDDTLIVAVDTMLPEQCPYVCERLRAAFS